MTHTFERASGAQKIYGRSREIDHILHTSEKSLISQQRATKPNTYRDGGKEGRREGGREGGRDAHREEKDTRNVSSVIPRADPHPRPFVIYHRRAFMYPPQIHRRRPVDIYSRALSHLKPSVGMNNLWRARDVSPRGRLHRRHSTILNGKKSKLAVRKTFRCAPQRLEKLFVPLDGEDRTTRMQATRHPCVSCLLLQTSTAFSLRSRKGWRPILLLGDMHTGRSTRSLPNIHLATQSTPTSWVPFNPPHNPTTHSRLYPHRHVSALDVARECHGSSSDYGSFALLEGLDFVAAIEHPILLGNLILLLRAGGRSEGERHADGKDPLDELHREPRR